MISGKTIKATTARNPFDEIFIMHNILTCLTACVFFSTQIYAQKNKPSEKKVTGSNDCCCKDTAACFEKDGTYIKQPANGSKDIILDFRARALGIPKAIMQKGGIKKGDYIRVKVVNYNPFLYKVSVDNRDSSVSQPIDAGFLGMFLSPDKFSGAVAGLISTVGTAPPSVQPPKINAAITEKVSYLNKNGFSPRMPMVLKDINDNLLLVLSDQDKVKINLEDYIKHTDSTKNEIIALRKKIEEKFYDITAEYANLQKLYLDCNSLTLSAIQAMADSYSTSLKSYLKEARDISYDIYDHSRQFKFTLAPYKTIIDSNATFKIKYNFVDTFFKIAALEVTALDTSVSSKKISEMYAAFMKLAQNTTCYTSLPIYISNDVKVLSISLKPVDDKSNLPAYQTSFAIPDYQYRIWGVSGGIYVCGLKNEIYTNKRISDTSFNLIAEKQNKIQIGVNALAYIGWRVFPKSNYLGACFGAGMSLESKPKPRILFGASFITGEKNRVSFSAGLVAGYVNMLSGGFSTTIPYTKPAENYQRDFLKASGFLSINYSFLSK